MTDQTTNTTNNVLSELVGDGKKFKTTEDLAKGKKDSDAYIAKLEGETKELRDVVLQLGEQNTRLEQKVDFLAKRSTQNVAKSDDPPADPQKTVQSNQTATGITENDVEKLLERRDENKTKAKNLAEVDAVLNKELGAKAKEFVAEKAIELGITPIDLAEIGQKNPSMFFKLIGLNPNNPKNSSMLGGLNGKGDTGNPSTNTRNKSYYDKIKTEKGAWKFVSDKALQIQMHKDMRDLGDAFFN